jgi:hypothetical protein
LQEVVVVPNLINSRFGDYLVEDPGYTRGADFHPVHQQHGILFVDNDVKMRLRLELIGKPLSSAWMEDFPLCGNRRRACPLVE